MFPQGRKLTAEDFRDKIKPQSPPEFKKDDRISAEALAAYIGKSNLADGSFDCSGRSKRVGNYSLDKEKWCTVSNLDKTYFKFVLKNHSHEGECTENGIVMCRKYIFVEKGDYLKCESWTNEINFYDQMTIMDGDSIIVTI